MEQTKRTYGQLIEELAALNDKAEQHARALQHVNSEIRSLEAELGEIQKPAEDWE